MTKAEIIYDIREKLQIHTDDSTITNEYISHLIDVKRLMFLKQWYSTVTKTIPITCTSQICMQLEVVDKITGSPEFGHMLRSKEIIPNVINISGREDVIEVRSIDHMTTGFNQVAIERFPYLGHNKYLNSQIYCAIGTDNRMYFYSKRSGFMLMSSVTARGVFESPSKADEMSCTSKSDEFENEYPVDGAMISDIVSSVIKELVVSLQIPKDELNDSKDDREAEKATQNQN